jgi:hypothetical protein
MTETTTGSAFYDTETDENWDVITTSGLSTRNKISIDRRLDATIEKKRRGVRKVSLFVNILVPIIMTVVSAVIIHIVAVKNSTGVSSEPAKEMKELKAQNKSLAQELRAVKARGRR